MDKGKILFIIIPLLVAFGLYIEVDFPNTKEIKSFIPLITYKETLRQYNKALNFLRKPASEFLSEDVLVLPHDFKVGAVFSTIKEPSILLEVESRGFSLIDHLGVERLGVQSSAENFKNSDLMNNSLYSSFQSVLRKDLKDIDSQEKSKGQRRVRLFDEDWFSSAIARYELVGIVNRLDRVSFNPAHCGEMRFIYRLSYNSQKDQIYSRMPMTLMIKYLVTRDSNKSWYDEAKEYEARRSEDQRGDSIEQWEPCKRFAKSWVYPDVKSPMEFVDWLISKKGSLGEELLTVGNFHSVETNIQAARVPSSMRPYLSGHAVYLLRVFQKIGKQLIPTFMENTLDVDRINSSTELKAELKKYFSEERVFKRLDRGVLRIPDKFLAKRALSYSPFGIARLDNRLLNKIFNKVELGDIFNPFFKENKKFKKYFLHSSSMAAMRVNDLSCVGCHQGRATAGFHFLGIDKASTHPLNALIFEGSGHFELELKRRKKYLLRTLQNRIPDPKRNFSIAPPRDAGNKDLFHAGYGHFCGLPGSGFELWKCESGYTCQKVDEKADESDIGKCFPKLKLAGDPCVFGELTQESHLKDKFKNQKKQVCGLNQPHKYQCSPPSGGLPGGVCTSLLSDQFNEAGVGERCLEINKGSHEICGFFAGTGFSKCVQEMFAGNKTFVDCASKTLGVGIRGRCNEKKSCRNDYVCARTGKYDALNRDGACTPSYFVFQVRVDGHANPNEPRSSVPTKIPTPSQRSSAVDRNQ